MKFIDPKTDYAFKRIFGNENKKEILISFLNAILALRGNKEIKDVTILSETQLPKIKQLKNTFLDVRCIDKRGITYIVEMQVIYTKAFEKRILYYISKADTGQIEKAEDYPKLNQVIFLGILDFEMFSRKQKYLTKHLIKEDETGETCFEDLMLYFVELPKFDRDLKDLKDLQDKWIYFIKHTGSLQVIPEELKEKTIKEAFEIAKVSSMSKEEYELYEARSMYIQDERGRAEGNYMKGMEDGLEKGKEEGLKEGLEKGIEEGKIEERRGIAKNLIKLGLQAEQIATATGLSDREIKELHKE